MILTRIFLVILTLDSAYLTIIVNPSPVANVTYGKPLFFSCTFSPQWISSSLNILGETGFKFAIFNGGPCSVPSEKQTYYSVDCHGDTITYGVLQPKDGQIWRCTSSDSAKVKEHGNITVSLQPDPPVIAIQNSAYRIREGSNFSTPCTFSGAPIFNATWEHSTGVTHWSNKNQPLILSFNNISRSASGNYTCNVTVIFKGNYTATKTISLVVEYPPTLKASNDTTTNEGASVVTFTCEISEDGLPRNYSELYWQHWIGKKMIRELHSDNSLNPSSTRYTLSLTSVTYNDSGSYVCLLGNGIANLKGEINQTAMVDLVVQAKPRILHSKPEYHCKVGKNCSLQFEIIGHPAVHSSIIVKEGEATHQFRKEDTKRSVAVDIYDTEVNMDGTVVEMDFDKIKNRFRTTYQLIAENSMGRATHTFLIEGHEFPSEPFHIHFKEFESSALLEWSALTPDLDMTYEVIFKKSSREFDVERIEGNNSRMYEHKLTDLDSNSIYILQLCTTNAIGKNCSSTFKIKMGEQQSMSSKVLANEMSMSETTLIVIVIIGAIGLLSILVFILIVRKRKLKNRSSSLLSLERYNESEGRNSYSTQKMTNDLDASGSNGDSLTRSPETYLTPQWMTESSLRQMRSEGNEYASVDDPAILKLNSQRKKDNGKFQLNGGFITSPELPRRSFNNVDPRSDYLTMDTDSEGAFKSQTSQSVQNKIYQKPVGEGFEFTQYLTMGENEQVNMEVQSGGYSEVNYRKKSVPK
ncbi:titin-like isoform X2 [Saccostrea echinata]|uniref:titin-like isoform X2 n=1 Tax=Saccostrea echinata TaxID=191078 RepID=UPI002A7FD309|nr:titin-like isoform X2 [Saccostrea echinata]